MSTRVNARVETFGGNHTGHVLDSTPRPSEEVEVRVNLWDLVQSEVTRHVNGMRPLYQPPLLRQYTTVHIFTFLSQEILI